MQQSFKKGNKWPGKDYRHPKAYIEMAAVKRTKDACRPNMKRTFSQILKKGGARS